MKRVALTLATLIVLGVATSQPSARADTPTGVPIVLTHGQVHHRHGYYSGYGPAVVRPQAWRYPTAVVPFVGPPVVVRPPIYRVPQYYYYYDNPYYGNPYYVSPNTFQYYGPGFSFGVNF